MSVVPSNITEHGLINQSITVPTAVEYNYLEDTELRDYNLQCVSIGKVRGGLSCTLSHISLIPCHMCPTESGTPAGL